MSEPLPIPTMLKLVQGTICPQWCINSHKRLCLWVPWLLNTVSNFAESLFGVPLQALGEAWYSDMPPLPDTLLLHGQILVRGTKSATWYSARLESSQEGQQPGRAFVHLSERV